MSVSPALMAMLFQLLLSLYCAPLASSMFNFFDLCFQLSYSVPGLICRGIAVERAGKFSQSFFFIFLAKLLNSSLDEVLLAIGVAELFVESFFFVS